MLTSKMCKQLDKKMHAKVDKPTVDFSRVKILVLGSFVKIKRVGVLFILRPYLSLLPKHDLFKIKDR